jgi:hypothetical protein
MAASKFDPQKDETLAEIGRVDGPKGELVCSIMSYNGGDAKVALVRSYKNAKGEERLSSLGRLVGEEIGGVIGLLEDARQWLEDNG